MQRGITVVGLRQFDSRWRRWDSRLERAQAVLQRGLDAIDVRVNRFLQSKEAKFEAMRAQAIADRQATIRVMSDEIIELGQL